MEKIFTLALTLAVTLGTTALLANGRMSASESIAVQRANDGAFRDGLFIGHLAAERGKPAHPLVGRWASASDRASFEAGYRLAYNDSLARAR